jgi:hypothetical protein
MKSPVRMSTIFKEFSNIDWTGYVYNLDTYQLAWSFHELKIVPVLSKNSSTIKFWIKYDFHQRRCLEMVRYGA